MKKKIVIPRPFDGHIHFREWLHFLLEAEAESVVAKQRAFATFHALVVQIAMTYDGAVAMPNLKNGWVSTPEHGRLYVETLKQIIAECGRPQFRLLPTFRITHDTTPEMVAQFHELGIDRGKIYPDDPSKQNVTTHSFGGIHRFMDPQLIEVFRAMARLGMRVLSHNEMPGSHFRVAEQEFIPVVSDWLNAVPDLQFGYEHISTRVGVQFVRSAGANVFATITPQHLTQIEEHWCEDHGGDPNNECKPSMKTEGDREAIVEAAVSGDPQFGFGSDAAPHRAELKERIAGKRVMPGCFNLIAGIPTVIELFEQHGAFDMLPCFTSGNFCRWNGIAEPTEMVTYIREPWMVQNSFHGIINWRAGEELPWRELIRA